MNTALILGEPGTGKTTFARNLIEAHRHPRRRFLIWSEWGGFRGVRIKDAAALRQRSTWPPVAVLGGDPEDVVKLALEARNTTVVVDEIQHLAPATQRRFPKGSAMWSVLREGRHHRVFLVGITQFPLSVSADLRDAAHYLFCLRLSDPYQLSYVRQRCGVQFAAKVATHTGYAPLLWTPSSVQSEASHVAEEISP